VESELATNHFLLVFAAGVAAHIGLLNLWFWRAADRQQREVAHLWVAVFCFASLAFQAARYVELHADTGSIAVLMARIELAVGPLLGASLVFFGRALRRGGWRAWQSSVFLAGNLTISLVALSTNAFIGDEATLGRDWLGNERYETLAKPALALFLPYVIGLLVAISRDVRGAEEISPSERRVLVWSLAIYAALAVQSTLTAMDLIPMSGMLAYGPIVVAVGLNHLLVDRHRRLLSELESMVGERTAELQDANGELAARLVELTTARDEAGAANAQLVASRERYRSLVESAPLGVLACDREGYITMVNSYLMKMIGSSEPSYGGGASLFEMVGVQDAGLLEPLKRCIETGRAETAEASFTSQRFEKTTLIRMHLAALRDGNGEITGAQAIIEDVGDRKALELRVRESQKMEAVGRLAAGIAHEINNPMAYVRSNLTMLEQEAQLVLDELSRVGGASSAIERLTACRELIAESLEGVNRTVEIVRDVKEFSHMGVAPEDPVDVNEVLTDCLRVAASQLRPGIELASDLREAPFVRCSASRLRQVFLNLIMNAAYAVGERGRVAVETRVEGDEVCVRVMDDGCGIPEEVRPRIFEPFFTTKPAGEGTGLGLYISYELVRQQNGTIVADARPGGGTVFEVRFPH
jgi:PAS domain S-box-containing protein